LTIGLIQYYLPTYFGEIFGDAVNNLPLVVFFILCGVMSVLAFLKNLSLIPLLGLISCCYLLTGMAVSNWQWFGIWLIIGLIFYFAYGYKNSKLNKK
jgi:predicted membrane channel-forming protein YqfA (hemolysin III family)